jgi:SAM-dependent methyltransferase
MSSADECLRRVRKLDPRPTSFAASHPIRGAVNIPFEELESRTMELPPRGRAIEVAADPPLAEAATALLANKGWRPRTVIPHYGKRPNPSLRLWEPNPFLSLIARPLIPDRVLDLGAGSGRNAVFLAAMGSRVTAVDVLEDAIQMGRMLESRYRPSDPRYSPIRWLCLDLEHEFDAIEGPFDMVVGFFFLFRPLFHRIVHLLAPGGSVVWETFTEKHRQRFGKPSTERYVLKGGELKQYFSTFCIRHYSEQWRRWGDRELHTARIWARYSP